MKKRYWAGALLLAATLPVSAAQNSCERVKADIEQRIINNGVPETGFTLTIVPNDQADQPDAQVVGHCANDTQKILYTRTQSGNASGGGTSQGMASEPQ
ncbi:DUF1161 domain-containing protein [Cronobacter sakazakii]|nr:DUF1161 domain-containing protein [Cronobacter sakazakii]ELY2758464.1 DUF1161 domain-containing protein [Cronobacter sakazakii]ELY3995978.1 DUF1161 domain-containing protein [Cronobacter sakazakii]ELY4069137.1 DUF1161 domain-containing protein [Cronobacter sakazakii]ELY4094316.1 DUF1161 domain-containing protein [Cronobacter sakazakii]